MEYRAQHVHGALFFKLCWDFISTEVKKTQKCSACRVLGSQLVSVEPVLVSYMSCLVSHCLLYLMLVKMAVSKPAFALKMFHARIRRQVVGVHLEEQFSAKSLTKVLGGISDQEQEECPYFLGKKTQTNHI